MRWNKYTVKTLAQAEDIVASSLMDMGIEGVEIQDQVPLSEADKRQMFIDILPETRGDDDTAYLSFYLEEDADQGRILDEVRAELERLKEFADVGECSVAVSATEDKDWINNWKEFFKQFYIDDILIVPSWEQVGEKDRDRMIIHIDPGTAFGTGMHETTQLCIRQLRKYVKHGALVLDVGCGSGILSLMAIKFGASRAVMTDLDLCAVDATHENMEGNGIGPEKYEVMIGNIIDDEGVRERVGYGRYDIVAANILAEVLVPLTPVAARHLKKGGVLITSGIIDDKEETVSQAVRSAGLDILEVTRQGEWVSVTAVRR